MRVMLRVLILFVMPAMLWGAEASRQVILDEANVGSIALQKTLSTTSQTGFSFRIAGVELSDKAVSTSNYQEVKAISDTPEKFGETDEQGLPNLPVYSQMVAIPDQAGVRAEIVSSSFQIIENVDVYPFQPQPLDINPDSIPPFTKDDNFYQQDAFYPPELVQVQEPVIFRDLRMVSAVISPIQYNPARRELKVYTSVDWRLNYEGTDTRNQKIRQNNNISETFLPMYRALVPNADEMLANYQPIRGGYLILYPHTMPDSLVQDLARWKHLKGYSVVTVRDTAITHTPSNPTASQVFAYIQNAYNNWAVPPEFVCIMGLKSSGIPDYPHDGLSSDHQYACVDGSDYFADVMVTRMSMPITNLVMRTTIWKAIIYDKTPYMGDPNYWRRALSCAGNVSAVTPRLNVLWVREMLMRRGFQQVDTVFWWDGFSDAPGVAAITASLNNGVSLASYRGWGFPGNWGHPAFTTGNLDAVTGNNKIGPCCAPTCGTNDYGNSDDCFGQHWTTAGSLPSSLKGGPGYFGACGEDTKTKYDNPFMTGYYAAILMDGIHNFASATYMGKMELWNTFPYNRGCPGDVCHYTYSFNSLGEPEFEVRTGIPQAMTVTYPSTIPVGTSLLTVHVVGSNSLPLDSAYVCLVKGRSSEQVFVGGRTNSSGDITLNFSTTTADTMFVTVSAYNYIPHTGFTLVQAQPVAVNVNSIVLDDDNIGNSLGNNDGNANPSETVELAITLSNFGNSTTATNVSATLTSLNPDFFITVPTQSYGTIAPGGSATSGKFATLLANGIPNGEHYILQLNIISDQGGWTAAVPVDVKNMLFSNRGLTYPGNANNILDPGETSQLVISVQNLGQLAGTALSGVLTTSDTGITIVDGSADFGTIAIGATGSNAASPFSIQAHSSVYHGHNSNFNLALTSGNGSMTNMHFSLVVGTVSTYDPVGPDSYGYYLYDNTDGGFIACPTYNWVEISPYAGGSGTRVDFPLGTDDESSVINGLPFNIRYYGQSFSYLMASINGFVAFDTTRLDGAGHHWAPSDNNQIPEACAPDGLIAAFWDDLEYTGNNGVFKYFDSAAHRYIIEWKSCTHTNAPGNHPETFEAIFYDPAFYPTPTGDAEIVFQYQTVYNDDYDTYNSLSPGLFCTVGAQNLSNSDGLEYTFDNVYHPAAATITAGRAIKLTTVVGLMPPPNIAWDPNSFIKTASVGQIVYDTLNISNVGTGLLTFSITKQTDNRILRNNEDPAIPIVQSTPAPIEYRKVAGAKPGAEIDPLYPPVIVSHGGPDGYGYTWIDSDEPGGPTYNWVDISSVGTTATFTGSMDDGYTATQIPMGMAFNFYGTDYTVVSLCTNGWISFLPVSTSNYNNATLPASGAPDAAIYAEWDDLYGRNSNSACMYYHDTANNRFIVSWLNWDNYYAPYNTHNLQIILNGNNNTIVMQYGAGTSNTTCAVGIENETSTIGSTVVNNADYLHANLAIRFDSPSIWLFNSVIGGSLIGGHDTLSVVTLNATDLTAGTYTGHLYLDSNDPDQGSVTIPVSFTVGGTGTPNAVQTPANFTDTLQVGLSAPFNMKVKNTGTAMLTVGFSPSATWIATLPGPYNIAPGDSIIHAVTLSAVGLTPAVYNSSVVTTTNDPAHLSITMPIQLRVTPLPPPNIVFAPASFNESINQGATIARTLVIKNTGAPGGLSLIVNLTAIEGSLLVPPGDDNSSPVIASNGDHGTPPHILNDWLTVTPALDTIAIGDSLVATVEMSAEVVAPGSYTGHIALASNDPDTPNVTVPVSILVQSVGPNCHYIVGDVNNNGAFNGVDVVYSVSYFKGGNNPPYSCECTTGHTWFVAGDVNASCNFNGVDVTYMVSYFKGGAAPHPCPDCPPTFLGKPGGNPPIEGK
jgi:hypothetical protein